MSVSLVKRPDYRREAARWGHDDYLRSLGRVELSPWGGAPLYRPSGAGRITSTWRDDVASAPSRELVCDPWSDHGPRELVVSARTVSA